MSHNAMERFMAKVAVTDSGCWHWSGGVEATGYGRFSRGSRASGTTHAHRWAYENFVGPIPDGLHIDHLCRNRACVNPDHLEAVTPRENFLRGVGVAARNSRKTHCLRGHELTQENTYNPPKHPTWRACITCQQQRGRNRAAGINREGAQHVDIG